MYHFNLYYLCVESCLCACSIFLKLELNKLWFYNFRHIYEGIPVSEAIQENLQDSVTVLPPLSPEYLSEWQKVAEYYVERPRLILLGKSVGNSNCVLPSWKNLFVINYRLQLFQNFCGRWVFCLLMFNKVPN